MMQVNLENKTVTVSGSNKTKFEVPYDKLVIAVGANVNTFGIPGVKQHCFFMKNVSDAIGIRNKLIDLFEKANLPTTSQKEKNRLLSFVVVGAGPTGVETAAEISDFINEDVPKYYKNIKAEDINITVLEGLDRILNTYDNKIAEYTENLFKRQNIKIIKKAMVSEVNDGDIVYKDTANDKMVKIPYGLCVWSGGIGVNPFVRRFMDNIPEQENSRALLIDSRLRVKGTSDIYALGDCSSIDLPRIKKAALDLFKQADKDGSNSISFEELSELVDVVDKHHPQVGLHFRYIKEIFQTYDKDKDGMLSMPEFTSMLEEVDKKLKTIPATAQVATQQGVYLARKLNELSETKFTQAEVEMTPFRYHHLGSLVYIGEDQASIDFGGDLSMSGYSTYWLWRSIYLSELVSMRTRMLVGFDWFKKFVFGRDISHVTQ
ncbi:EF-Hand 1, calcium-binding site domain-containing protein [Rozella allomycis CSF55]|uniref:EF-Hand 1, calcium-binding site domain-containing protein n=1 Tax=Rozella allomycis (strain CSF55) TaxID=988480 RepID=A0A075ATD9_ROZAC|nr:EF-Hand 1, calcium-binding site domain-containing protein [Rozella allomycis CSF55]|eukprot:EPZ33518.1 EF-Hand 1, calcium-binding site domain-containing protein [Rozella allomycis CSF55]